MAITSMSTAIGTTTTTTTIATGMMTMTGVMTTTNTVITITTAEPMRRGACQLPGVLQGGALAAGNAAGAAGGFLRSRRRTESPKLREIT